MRKEGSQAKVSRPHFKLLVVVFFYILLYLVYFLITYFWLCWISVAVQRFSLVVVHWLLTAVASLAVEHRLSCAKLQ